MNKNSLTVLTIGLVAVLIVSAATAFYLSSQSQTAIRVACVGDSLTQSTEYPYDLWLKLGENYTVRNFGAGSTTVSLDSETPYMNSDAFKEAIAFQPNIVVIMLGTNDAQPSIHRYNASFVSDYVQLIDAFKALPSRPQIWVVLPPPIFSNQSGRISPEYFTQTVLPGVEQAANLTGLPIIDVYSVLREHPEYFFDGVHANSAAADVIANEVHSAIMAQYPDG